MSYSPTSPCLAERMPLSLLKNVVFLCHVTRDFLNVLVINKLRACYLIEKKTPRNDNSLFRHQEINCGVICYIITITIIKHIKKQKQKTTG